MTDFYLTQKLKDIILSHKFPSYQGIEDSMVISMTDRRHVEGFVKLLHAGQLQRFTLNPRSLEVYGFLL
jgi:hypothetical protein